MKDSKYQIHVSLKQEDAQRTESYTAAEEKRKELAEEDGAASVLKWSFPSGQAAKPGQRAADQRLDERGRGGTQASLRYLGGEPDASGMSGAARRAAAKPQPPGRGAGAAPADAARAGGPAAQPGPPLAAEPPRFAQAAAGRVPRGGRTFRARPPRGWRRGFAARRGTAARQGRRVQMHPALWAVAVLLALALALPLLVVDPGNHKQAPLPPGPEPLPSAEPSVADEPAVSVYITATDTVEELPLETYLVGVLAAEMPAEFQLEALKAQAIAARTYIVQRLVSGDRSGVPDELALVTDTVNHQAYISRERLEKEWAKAGKEAELAKLTRAVSETEGVVMTYQGKPITASFFSTSNGYTENSEDYWKNEIPYLRSVESPWDREISPKYKDTIAIPQTEFLSKLGLSDGAIPVSAGGEGPSSVMKILSYTQGKRIEKLRVGGKTFTGREARERLGLRSSQFSWKVEEGNVIITTYGYGHGVGMSQYGAEGMAREGHTAKEILKHYYTGISFDKTSNLLSSKK